MSEAKSHGEVYLEKEYDEIYEALADTSLSYPKANQLDVEGLTEVQLGKVLHYLKENDVIGMHSERRTGADIYDLTGFEPEDLEELAEEELELD